MKDDVFLSVTQAYSDDNGKSSSSEEDVEIGEDVESIEESGSANSTAMTFLVQ